MESESDIDLIRRVLDGDGRGFDQLVQLHGTALRAFLYARVREDLVDDLMQETLLRSHIGLPDLEDPSRFRSWLIGIAANLVRMRYRTQLTRSSILDEYETSNQFEIQVTAQTFSPEEDLLISEDASAVYAAIASLPDESRKVVELHYLEGYTYKKIADLLGIRIPTIEGRLYRARKQLREDLKMTQTTTDMFELQDRLTALQDQVDELQKQQRRIAKEDEMAMGQERSAAASQILRLPVGEDEPITWGILGAFRTDSQNSKRTALRTTSIDNYLDQLTSEQIASFARVFSDPNTVGILKQLVRGSVDQGEIEAGPGQKKKDLTTTLNALEADQVIVREGRKIKAAHSDVIVGLLSLISLGQMYHMNVTGEIDIQKLAEQEAAQKSKVRTRTRKSGGESSEEMVAE